MFAVRFKTAFARSHVFSLTTALGIAVFKTAYLPGCILLCAFSEVGVGDTADVASAWLTGCAVAQRIFNDVQTPVASVDSIAGQLRAQVIYVKSLSNSCAVPPFQLQFVN